MLQSRPPTVDGHSSVFRKATAGLTEGALQLSGTLRNAASNLWSLADLRTMLQIHADDPALLQMVRHTDPEQHAPHSPAARRQQITQLRDAIEAAPDLEARFRQQLLGDIKAVEDALQPLEHGTGGEASRDHKLPSCCFVNSSCSAALRTALHRPGTFVLE